MHAPPTFVNPHVEYVDYHDGRRRGQSEMASYPEEEEAVRGQDFSAPETALMLFGLPLLSCTFNFVVIPLSGSQSQGHS